MTSAHSPHPPPAAHKPFASNTTSSTANRLTSCSLSVAYKPYTTPYTTHSCNSDPRADIAVLLCICFVPHTAGGVPCDPTLTFRAPPWAFFFHCIVEDRSAYYLGSWVSLSHAQTGCCSVMTMKYDVTTLNRCRAPHAQLHVQLRMRNS